MSTQSAWADLADVRQPPSVSDVTVSGTTVIVPAVQRTRAWCATWNNYEQVDIDYLTNLFTNGKFVYLLS